MKTAGEILKEKRIEKSLTYQDIEKATKIRQKFIIALENNDLDNLPGKTYTRGFVKNYSEFLGLSTNSILAILRRQYNERKKGELLPQGLEKPLTPSKIFGQKLTIPLAFSIAIVMLGIYLYFQYRFLIGAPNLEVESPKENLIIQSDSVMVKGKTDKEIKIILNGQEVAVNNNGTFTQEIKIKEGENSITIIAINKQGKGKKIERTVIRETP